MLTRSRAAALGLVVCLFAAQPARAAIELDPGMWQDSETGEENGQPSKPEVTSDCMTPEEAKDPVKSLSVMKDTGGHCTKLEIKEKGNVVSVDMRCGDPKEMSIEMTGTYTGSAALHRHDEIDRHPRRQKDHRKQVGRFEMDRGVQE